MKKILVAILATFTVFATTQTNEIPARLQWLNNSGYCGEASLISAGLYYGQYLSQFDARAIATQDGSQTGGSLLLGINDTTAAQKMHLAYEEWDTDSEQNSHQFLIWLKQQVAAGHPVAIGIYANQYLFYGTRDRNAGDSDYDHIVPVTTLISKHPLSDPSYYGDDQVGFNDNGLWDNGTTPVYYFIYAFDPFQDTRAGANKPTGPIYSLSNNGSNYGIAITGVKDLNGDTLPVRVDTHLNYEIPEIADNSNTRPSSMPLTLTITVSNLEPHTLYHLYRYNKLESVPESHFNANGSKASETWPFKVTHGSTFTKTEVIRSSDSAIYRCVKASAP